MCIRDRGKAIEEIFALLPKEASYYLSAPAIARAMPINKISMFAKKNGLAALAYPSVLDAVNAATSAAQEEDVIYVGGSNFVVADFFYFLKL